MVIIWEPGTLLRHSGSRLRHLLQDDTTRMYSQTCASLMAMLMVTSAVIKAFGHLRTSTARHACTNAVTQLHTCTWVVVKTMVPFWVPIIIRPLLFRVPKKGP